MEHTISFGTKFNLAYLNTIGSRGSIETDVSKHRPGMHLNSNTLREQETLEYRDVWELRSLIPCGRMIIIYLERR